MPNFLDSINIINKDYAVRPDKLFGNYTRSKKPYGLTAWNDGNYLYTNGVQLAMNRTGWGAGFGDDGPRGYNASAASMTGIDAMFRDSLDQASIILGIKDKDWDEGQKAAIIDKALGDWHLLHILKHQFQYFDLLLNPEEDSALTTGDEYVWSHDDLMAVISSLTSRNYPILNISKQLAELTSPVFLLSMGYPDKGYPPQYYIPCETTCVDDTPTKGTLAVFNQLKSVMYTTAEGLIHAKKISLSWEPFSLAMVKNYQVRSAYSDRLAMLYRHGSFAYYYDGAAPQAFVIPGEFYSANHASGLYPIEKDGALDEIFSYMPLIQVYHVNNNVAGCFSAGTATTTEDKMYGHKIAYNAATYSVNPTFADVLECLPILSEALLPALVLTGAGDAAQAMASKNLGALLYGESKLSVTGISQTVFEDALLGKLVKLWSGGDLMESSGMKGTQNAAAKFKVKE